MAKKLGKRARKFARKGLQVVQKQKRKHNSTLFKRKTASRAHAHAHAHAAHSPAADELEVNHLHHPDKTNMFAEEHHEEEFDDDDFSDSDSDSGGYLSEEEDCPYISDTDNHNHNQSTDITALGTFHEENTKINLQISKHQNKLDKLLAKDEEFAKFLESRRYQLDKYNRMVSDDEEEGDEEEEEKELGKGASRRAVTRTTLDVWCWMVTENPKSATLCNLLNLYRDASLYGVFTSRNGNDEPPRIVSPQVYSRIINFVLSEADGIFRTLLGLPENCNSEKILSKLKSSKEWLSVGPLVKSYLKSSLKLLNQVTDSTLLVFVLSRLMESVVFLHAFPSLGRRLTKILVGFWSTGEEQLSASSFLLMKEAASLLSVDHLKICMKTMYRTFIARCKFVDDESNLRRIEFLKSSLLEITSLDVQQSYVLAISSLQWLAGVVKQVLRTQGKEELMKINNWQYINCLSLWVKFTCINYKENSLQQLFDVAVRVIFGVTNLFKGPRFLPLKIKCVQMLNDLSLSSGRFIPVSSLVLECLEYIGEVTGKVDGAQEPRLKLSSLLQVPKNLLKSRQYQEECARSCIEVLSAHLSEWSYHVSLPELSTIPLILLKRFHEKATTDSVSRFIKRFIDQAEQNRDFIEMKRDGVSFSPNDETSVDNFLLLEKSNASSSSFSQFYASMLHNSQARNDGLLSSVH